jgi:type IV pilus assembly protein PilA
MKTLYLRRKALGQGMTEYIIIVALIAVAAIGVYQAFGGIIRGQTSQAAATLAGDASTAGRDLVNNQQTKNDAAAKAKTLKDFEK